jgi:hypothetical protein
MRDLGSTFLLYSLRVGLVSLEPIPNTAACDYSDLKSLLGKYVAQLQSDLNRSNNNGQAATDEACMSEPTLSQPISKRDIGLVDSESRTLLPAASLISIARTMLRTLERSSQLPADNPALEKLREAVAEIILELAPAAKKEPKFVLRTGPDLYSRKAG